MAKLEPSKLSAWLREHLIPRLADVFREEIGNEDSHNSEFTITRPRDSFFLSDLFFATIRFRRNDNGVVVEKSLLIKLPAQDPQIRSRQNYDYLFANEMLFYKRLADGSSDYPLCYLCCDIPVFDKVIVLENVCPRGYSVCPSKLNLDLDYLIAGLRSIAHFHGRTYSLKEREPAKFNEIVGSIIKIRYDTTDPSKTASYANHVNTRIKRITRELLARCTKNVTKADKEFATVVSGLFDDCYSSLLMRSVEPREPLATIVHGDCTANNVLFKINNDETKGDGYRYEAMLVDFALIMYSSPATDVSTFLYMSAKRHVVKTGFRELFKAYHDALANYLKDHEVWDPVKYSYEAFAKDYEKSAIFGYVISTFFLPMMTEYANNPDLMNNVDEAIERLNLTGGGDELTDQLVDTLIDMRETGLLDHYVAK